MQRSGELDALLEDARVNAWIGWVLVAFVASALLESVGTGDWVWAIATLSVLVIAVLPPVAFRTPHVMLPWEVLLLAVLPLFVRTLATPGMLSEVATYLSVAAVALLIAVELDVFTAVRMTTAFAVVFVVLVTMATAGAWAIVQWLSDVYLGTTFIYPTPPPVDPAVDAAAHDSLMWDFVAATAAGVLAGVVFAIYFRERANTRVPVPDELDEALE
ncbi:MAG: hypothetical protein ABEJ76_05365 [Halanaeroarchaeum sp.]